MADTRQASDGAVLRAISGEAGTDTIRALVEEDEVDIPMAGDGTRFSIDDAKREEAFRTQLMSTPRLIENPLFRQRYKFARELSVGRYLRERSDQLSRTALLSSGRLHKRVVREHDDPGKLLVSYMVEGGADLAGGIAEFIGPSGSGKSEKLAWWAIRSAQLGIPVCTNVWVNVEAAVEDRVLTPEQGRLIYESHRMSTSLAWLADKRLELASEKQADRAMYFIRDEAGVGLDGSSMGVTTLEGRWGNKFLATMRHIGVAAVRARQSDTIPRGERGWVTIEIRMTKAKRGELDVTYLDGPRRGMPETIINIDRVNRYCDTTRRASFDPDVDMEALEKYTARYEADEPIAVTWSRYAHAAVDGRDLLEEEVDAGRKGKWERTGITVTCKKCGANFQYHGVKRSAPGLVATTRHSGCNGYADLPMADESSDSGGAKV